jgi:hypothetical protein
MRAALLLVLLLGCAAPCLAQTPDSSRVAAVPHAAPDEMLDASTRSAQTGYLAPDKLEHASLSLTAGLMIGVTTREPAAALGGAFALGLGKELWDSRRTFFDRRDLVADLVGATAAALITHALTR